MISEKEITIRPATRADIPLILGFIRDLADYEKLLHEVKATADMLAEDIFGENPVAHVVIGELDGKAEGFALYFYNYSTFVGRRGIYLEDLFVSPDSRGSGLGKALILHLAALSHEQGCGRLEWAVLNWNSPSIEFYKSLGAKPQDEWTGYRLDRDAMERLIGA